MKRREFFTLAAGAAVAFPFTTRAEQPGRLPIVAILGDRASSWRPWVTAFADRLRELGWIEGRTVTIECYWPEGRPERVSEVVPEIVKQNVSVVVTYGSAAAVLKKATTSIPIVFAVAVDPIGTGLVASLAQPGGNVTGLSLQQAEIGSKRVGLMRQMVPNLRRLGIVFDASYPGAVREDTDVQAIARRLGLEVVSLGIKEPEDVAAIFENLKGHIDALYVVENALINANRKDIIARALDARLPTSFVNSDNVRDGAFMAYGADFPSMFRGAADYVDKILHGAKPVDLPVAQPTKFNFVINLKTAKTLGIEIPGSMQLLADEVIE